MAYSMYSDYLIEMSMLEMAKLTGNTSGTTTVNADRLNYQDTISPNNKNVFYSQLANKNIKDFKSIYHNELIQNEFSINYSVDKLNIKAYNFIGINNIYQRKYLRQHLLIYYR